MKSRNFLISLASVALLLEALGGLGCRKEEPVYRYSHEEAILQYLNNSPDARQLFRTDGLFTADSFVIPLDEGAYHWIFVDSVKRRIQIFADSLSTMKEFPNLGVFSDAEVAIDDIFYLRTRRVAGTDTTEREIARGISRYAYFLKLGEDWRDYFGWKLYGCNLGFPGDTVRVLVTPEHDTTFRGDALVYDNFHYFTFDTIIDTTGGVPQEKVIRRAGESTFQYLKLANIGVISRGDSVSFDVWRVENRSYYLLYSALTDEGYRTYVMNRPDSGSYAGGLKTAAQNPAQWEVIFLQEYRRFPIPGGTPPDTMGLNWYGWGVPYRVVSP